MARGRRRKLAEPSIDLEAARQLVKCSVVILRDHSPMTFEEAALAFAYCWNHTESVEASEARETRARG